MTALSTLFTISVLCSVVPVLAKDAAKDSGCEVPRLVSTGGPVARNPNTLAIRWTGYSNFELSYGGQIILLDAYFDRGPEYLSLIHI